MKVEWLCTEYRNVQLKIEHAINSAPTGDKRNLLTEANILAMLAQEKLDEAARTL